jgi:hypothetical protein
MTRRGLGVHVLVGLGLTVALGCRGDEPRMAEAPPDTLPPVGRVETTDRALPAGIAAETVRREADQLDRHVMELRTHIATMRQISPRMAGTVMQEHASHVRALGERVQAQRAALPVPDAQLPILLGMSGDEYRVMLEEVRIAAAEVSELQRGTEDQIRETMPGHLDRLERVAGQLEHAAASLRR